MDLARHISEWSKDSTKVGAVLVGPEKEVRLTAFNGPPKGVVDLPERFLSPGKYLYAAHAEANLVAFAARAGIRTEGCTVYVTHHPCAACARSLVQSGVSRVIAGGGAFSSRSSWESELYAACMMFQEAGVDFEEWVEGARDERKVTISDIIASFKRVI